MLHILYFFFLSPRLVCIQDRHFLKLFQNIHRETDHNNNVSQNKKEIISVFIYYYFCCFGFLPIFDSKSEIYPKIYNEMRRTLYDL